MYECNMHMSPVFLWTALPSSGGLTSNSLWIFFISFFMVAWGFGFWMWRQTLARVVLYRLSAEYSVVMYGAWTATLVTWPWIRLSMIYCCALRLSSQICARCRRCWFPVSVALSCCVGARCLGPVGWLHTFEMVTEYFADPNLCVVVAKCWFLGFVVWDRTFMCTVFIATLT